MTLANLKGSVAKESIIVGLFLVGVLLFSSFMVFASRTDLTLESYMANADYLSGGFSDEQVLDMVETARGRLSDEDITNIEGFSHEQILSVARGSSEGVALVESMTSEERTSAENLLRTIVSSGSLRSSYAWPWRKATPPAPAPPTGPAPVPGCPNLPGTCTPGVINCQEFETPVGPGACEYTCGPAGTWVPSLVCTSNWCHATRCL